MKKKRLAQTRAPQQEPFPKSHAELLRREGWLPMDGGRPVYDDRRPDWLPMDGGRPPYGARD